MKKQAGIKMTIMLYLMAAIAIAYVIRIGGNYPTGVDTMCHVYKGDVLYHAIRQGNWYPLYDRFWYNCVQMMRYWAPLPVYFLAFCQAIAGGVDLEGYLVFVSLVFYLGALVWLYIGIRKNRLVLGAFMGGLWFFMPNNLYALFVEGNLPRSLSMVLLPLFIYFVSEYLFENNWRSLIRAVPVFVGIALCHVGDAGMIALAMLLFLLVYRILYHRTGKCIPVIVSIILPFMIIGIWLYASLKGGITSTDSSQVMKGFFQDAVISLNPLRRLTRGNTDFYFGFAAFVVAVFGAFCSKRRSMTGFWAALLIFVCTTTSMYTVLSKLPGSQYLWMLRFISIALVMILYSFMMWTSLKRGFVILCCVLLVLDCIPSYGLIWHGIGERTAKENMQLSADASLITKARSITKQRVALMDGSSLGAMAPYLLTDYDEEQTQGTYGAGWQSAATAVNIVELNEAAERGFYPYLFDRALELGNDTVLIKISELKNGSKDIPDVTNAAKEQEFTLVQYNDSFLLYHREISTVFGTVCKYDGLAIGNAAASLTCSYPDITRGDSANLDDYTFAELSGYKVIYLSGFSYSDKTKAEKLVKRLSNAGVKIIISGDGIPQDAHTKERDFLGVSCQDIYFENGYPILYTAQGELDTLLFDKENAQWKTVYFNGLDQAAGYLYDSGMRVDFAGTVYNDNIVFIGLNLSYHYFLTKDENVGAYMDRLMGDQLNSLPDRTIVPLKITYRSDEIRIESPRDNVNTSLAYHDIFHSKQKLLSEHALTVVRHGVTVIRLKYPYVMQGMILSLAGIIGYLFFILWLRRKHRHLIVNRKQLNKT